MEGNGRLLKADCRFNMNWKYISIGLLFAILWSSASTATKLGLQSAQPFVIAISRFLLAGCIMVLVAHGIMRQRLPQKKEWGQIAIYGFLNISIYLGLYVVAMQRISAGLGSLAVAVNPVMISFISALWYKQKMKTSNYLSLLLCTLGVFIAAIPSLQRSYASVDGILVLLASMLAYSLGAIYYANKKWGGLHLLTINGWQTLIGGAFLLPVLLLTYQRQKNVFDFKFFIATFWLAIPVSIAAVQLWMVLLKKSAVTASYWLFLCPIFGFLIAAYTLLEPIGAYTVAGVLLVLIGLFVVQRARY
jgi:drug/metabolite transporter (DMT)-like permease